MALMMKVCWDIAFPPSSLPPCWARTDRQQVSMVVMASLWELHGTWGVSEHTGSWEMEGRSPHGRKKKYASPDSSLCLTLTHFHFFLLLFPSAVQRPARVIKSKLPADRQPPGSAERVQTQFPWQQNHPGGERTTHTPLWSLHLFHTGSSFCVRMHVLVCARPCVHVCICIYLHPPPPLLMCSTFAHRQIQIIIYEKNICFKAIIYLFQI